MYPQARTGLVVGAYPSLFMYAVQVGGRETMFAYSLTQLSGLSSGQQVADQNTFVPGDIVQLLVGPPNGLHLILGAIRQVVCARCISLPLKE